MYKKLGNGNYANAQTGEVVKPQYIEALQQLQLAFQSETTAGIALGEFEREHAEIFARHAELVAQQKQASQAVETAKEAIRENPGDGIFVIRANAKRDVFGTDAELVDYLVERQLWGYLLPDKKSIKKLDGLPDSIYQQEPYEQLRVKVDHSLLGIEIED
jgi:tetratricopeptide (TPR) repeat protein